MTEHVKLFVYSEQNCSALELPKSGEILFNVDDGNIRWLNQVLDDDIECLRKIINDNQLDEFLINLVAKKYKRNKLLELSNINVLFAKSLRTEPEDDDLIIRNEQIVFIVGKSFIWTLQEIIGDEFDHIRDRLIHNRGIVRRRPLDYLLFLMLEAIIENYFDVLDDMVLRHQHLTKEESIKPTPEFSQDVEQYKNQLFYMKRTALALKESLLQVNIIDDHLLNPKYLTELLAQIQNFSEELDQHLNKLDSSINMIFSIQNHKLNEIMKTLTIISVVFMPLSFVAGLYGMNFRYMPELAFDYGYFVVLAVMLIIVIISITMMKRKNWF